MFPIQRIIIDYIVDFNGFNGFNSEIRSIFAHPFPQFNTDFFQWLNNIFDKKIPKREWMSGPERPTCPC